MTGSKFIVSTRPAEKFSMPENPCTEIVNIPLTEISEMNFKEQEIEKIVNFDPDAVAFTSQRGVEIFFSDIDPHMHRRRRRYYGVGKSTCRAVEENGYDCVAPVNRDSHGLGELLIQEEIDSRVLLFRSAQANRVLDELLSDSSIDFLNIEAYRVNLVRKPDVSPLHNEDCAAVVFTSSMEVEAFVSLLGHELPGLVRSGIRFFSIGSFTTLTMKKHSIPVSDPVGNSDFEQLIQDICTRYFRK